MRKTEQKFLENMLKVGVKCWYCRRPYHRLCDFVSHTNGRFTLICYLCVKEWIEDGRPNRRPN